MTNGKIIFILFAIFLLDDLIKSIRYINRYIFNRFAVLYINTVIYLITSYIYNYIIM